MSKQIEFQCPMCKTHLRAFPVGRGITLVCTNTHGKAPGQCPAQEVAGYGRDEKAAFEIVKAKYKPC